MTDLEDLGLEDSPFSDFLGFELLLEEQDRELLSSRHMSWLIYRILGERSFITRFPAIASYYTESGADQDTRRIALAEKGATVAAEVVADLVGAQLDRGPVSASDFVHRLETAGVSVIPNLSATTGKLSGFAYELDGERVTASAMGRGFTLANLTKRGLTYEPNRDLAFLNARRRGGAGSSSRGRACGV